MDHANQFLGSFSLPDYPTRVFHHCRGWDKLAKVGETVYYPHNTVIVYPGDEVKYCYVVIEGRVISMEDLDDGNKNIFNLFKEGGIFLESNLLIEMPSAVYFCTLCPTELVRIDRDALQKAMKDDFDITHIVTESISYKYYSAMDQLRENYSHDTMWKVYNLLLIFAANVGTPRGDWVYIDMKISQQMLSDFLGINRVTIGKALTTLKERDLLLIVNGRYCIPTKAIEGLH